MELLSRSGVTVKGKHAVVVGRSNIVGLPVSLLLLKADATVSIVHSRTPNPETIVRQADIVIAAAGQAMMVHYSAAISPPYFMVLLALILTAVFSWLLDQGRLDQTRRGGHRRRDKLHRRPNQEVWVQTRWRCGFLGGEQGRGSPDSGPRRRRADDRGDVAEEHGGWRQEGYSQLICCVIW